MKKFKLEDTRVIILGISYIGLPTAALIASRGVN